MSNFKMVKENTERQKNAIIRFVRGYHRKGCHTKGTEIIEFCIDKMEIGKTTAKKLVQELEKENKLYSVDVRNNGKYYYPTDYLHLPKGSFIVKGEIGELEILDKELKKIEKAYTRCNLLEKISVVHYMLEKIFRRINRLILSNSISKPSDISRRTMIIKYQKLIHRLHQIALSSLDPDKDAIAMVFYLFPNVSLKELLDFIPKTYAIQNDPNDKVIS